MTDRKFRIVDFFAGMGNFRAGFERAGAECVYSVEWDKYKRRIYKEIYGKEPDANDIRTVCARDIPDAECWCFGSPCVSFSLSGKRTGLGGESGLIKEIFRLLKEKEPEARPEFLLAENVVGQLSSNHGWDYAIILSSLDELGYDVSWRLFNSKDYGVAQNRERIYTCGFLRGRGHDIRQIFPL